MLFLPVLAVVMALGSVRGIDVSCPQGDFEYYPEEEMPCISKECINAAARIQDMLDESVDPCDNFYDFACGGWIKAQVLPPYKSTVQSFSTADKMVATSRNVLLKESTPSELSSVRKAKNLYASCISYVKGVKPVEPLRDFLNETFGGWPLTLEEWNEADFDFEDALAKTVHYGASAIMGFGVTVVGGIVDGIIKANHSLQMKTPSFGLPSERYFSLPSEHVILQTYLAKIEETAKEFKPPNNPRMEEEIVTMLEFEMQLANLSLISSGIEVNESNAAMTLTDLQEEYGTLLDWARFASLVGIKVVTNSTIIFNTAPFYYDGLKEYLDKVPKRVVANYLVWRVIDSFQSVLVDESEKVDLMYKQAINGANFVPPAEETCIEYVSKAFELVMHRLLYAEKLPEEEIFKIRTMMSEIQDAFDDTVAQLDWVDEQTREIIREKNDAVTTKFVYFDRVMNDTYLENFYANLSISRDHFFKNLLEERQEFVRRKLKLLNEPFRLTGEELPYQQVAFNSFFENTIKFSAGMFEPPFYSRNVPLYLNYGGMGYVYGHELMHGFDNSGYKHSAEGIQGEWWSKEASEKFEQSHQCLVDQYDNFYLEEAGMNVNGNQTLGENIADCAGIRQAFKAYRNSVCAHGKEEPRLPSLDYTGDQLFFISAAQVWCLVEDKTHAEAVINIDVHSPARFRVIGSAQNSRDFANAFKCPAGSYMNPEDKCDIW